MLVTSIVISTAMPIINISMIVGLVVIGGRLPLTHIATPTLKTLVSIRIRGAVGMHFVEEACD